MAVLNFPSNPVDGQAYVAPNGSTYIYDATETVWKAQGADGDNTVVVSATAPVSPTQGKLWWNTTTGTLFIYYQDGDSNQWIPAAIPGPASILDGQSVIFEDISVKSLNNGPLAGLRNQIINGNYEFNQRGIGLPGSPTTLAGNSYGLDRWYFLGGDTIEQVAVNAGPVRRGVKITGPSNGYMRTMVETLNSSFSAFQPGTTWTISIWATSTPTFNASFADDNSTVTNPITVLGQTQMIASSEVIGSLTRYYLTFTVPNGISPSANTNGLIITFRDVTSPATYSACQLEPGTAATPFEQRPLALELSLCQRYFQQKKVYAGGCFGSSGGAPIVGYSFSPSFRSQPTAAYISGGTASTGAADYPITRLSQTQKLSEYGVRLIFAMTGTAASKDGCDVFDVLMKFDAEL